jgi:hypothetical protein
MKGSIAVIGGWGQSGGYGPISAQYGLGVDQWLEAKVITADGELKVANAVSNPDLLWALRGGGGGTFGIVFEATIKAHPDVPITGYNWYINSTEVATAEQLANGVSPMTDAMKYLLGQLPALQEKGISAYFYVQATYLRVFAVHLGKNAGIGNANAVWAPILEKMQSFPNMTKFQTKPYEFKNFKEFFGTTYGKMDEMSGMINDKRSVFQKRHGPAGAELPRYRGIFPYDSRLLSASHLRDPNIMRALKGTRASYGILLCAPGMAVGNGTDTSVNPGWRRAVVHFVGSKSDRTNIDELRKLAPDMGSYINEVRIFFNNWPLGKH